MEKVSKPKVSKPKVSNELYTKLLQDILKELKIISPEISRIKKDKRDELIRRILLAAIGIPIAIPFIQYAGYKYSKPINVLIKNINNKMVAWGMIDDVPINILSFKDWFTRKYGLSADIITPLTPPPSPPAQLRNFNYFFR